MSAGEIARLESHLRSPPSAATYSPGDGAIDPVAVSRALLEAARAHGAQVRTACAIAVRRDGRRVAGVETSTGFVPAGDVVLAAGVGVSALCAPLGVDLPIEPSPAVLVRCTAPRDLVRTLVATPEAEVRGTSDGGLVAAMAYDGQEGPEQIGRRLLAWLAATFRGADTVRVTGVEVGLRPMPADGIPIVGRLPGAPGVHVAVVHPGVQLAPVVGRLVAELIATGVDSAELRDWSPARFVPG